MNYTEKLEATSSRAKGGYPAPSDMDGGGEGGAPEFDPKIIWRFVLRNFWLITIVGLVVVAIAAFIYSNLTPYYTAQARVLINTADLKGADIESVLTETAPDSGYVFSEVEIMRSRNLLQRVVNELDLMSDPEFNPALQEPTFLERYSPVSLVKRLIGSSEPETDPALKDEIEFAKVIDTVRDRLQVLRVGTSFVIQADFTSEVPEKAQRIVNRIVKEYELEQLEAKYEATQQTNEWLSERLDGLQAEVQAAERAVEIYKAENNLIGGSEGGTINQQQLSDINAQLIVARADLAAANAKLSRAREISRSGQSVASVGDVLQSQTIASLRGQEAELARKEAELAARYGERHPARTAIAQERRDLDRQIDQEVGRIISSIENEAAVARTRVRSLEQSLAEVESSETRNSRANVGLRDLERKAAASRSVYERFLNRFRETDEGAQLQTSDARVISEAEIPTAPSSPATFLYFVVTLMFAGAAGVGVALLREFGDTTIKSGVSIEENFGLPIVASVPRIGGKKGEIGRYVVDHPLSAFAEAIRSLRTGIALSDVDQPVKTVLITSSLPSEGKSTISLSLARMAAKAGERVLLLDLDLRRPNVGKLTGVTIERGIVEVLSGKVTLDEAIIVDEISSLQYVGVAGGTVNPSELIGSQQMTKLVESIRDQYDLIIFDSAPVLAVSDPQLVSRLADATFVVAQWGRTPRGALRNAITLLSRSDSRLRGAVLSQVDMKRQMSYEDSDYSSYYSYYSSYYHP